MHCGKLGGPTARQSKAIEQHCEHTMVIGHGPDGLHHNLQKPASRINAYLAKMAGTGPRT